MPSYENTGRFPKDILLASSVALFVVAIIATITRTVLRIHFHKRLHIDDGFLLFAVLLVSACVGVYVNFVDSMYLLQASIEGRVPQSISLSEIETTALRFHLLSDVFLVLSWTAIFAVKFGFLFFFKMLVRRIRAMEIYWHCVTIVTTITWVAGCVGTIASCPNFDDRALDCANDTSTKSIIFYTTMTFLDVGTDLAVIIIPVITLRRVQIKFRTKLVLGVSLCLSAVIIIAAITQVAGSTVPGQHKPDLVWGIYWQFIEGCVAIVMACLTAFRSFCIQYASRNQSSPRKPWYSGIKALLTSKSSRKSTQEACKLPPIPGPTLTGMSTYVEENGREITHDINNTQNRDEFAWPLQDSVHE